MALETEDFDADDSEDALSCSIEDEDDRKCTDLKYIDRSFTNMGYIGYGDGIDLHELDTCANQ